MITYTPNPDKPPPNPNPVTARHALIAAVALLIAGWIGYSLGGGDQIHARGTTSHNLHETATLTNGTTIQIIDIREERELTALNTGITLRYTAGPNGHPPTGDQPALTANSETHYPDTGIFITTTKGLDEPLAPGIEKTMTIGYKVPIRTLTNAQLNIDGALFAGDFTRRINNG